MGDTGFHGRRTSSVVPVVVMEIAGGSSGGAET
jgi:hypothetical protein